MPFPPVWVVNNDRLGRPSVQSVTNAYLVTPVQAPSDRNRGIWTLFG